MAKVIGDVVDRDTGEINATIFEGDRILRRQSIDYLKDTVELLPNESYIKTFIKPLSQLSEVLSGPEMFMTYYLLQYLSYDSGLLMHANGKLLTRKRICDELGQSERQVDRTLESLKEKEVIKKVLGAKREVSFLVNPWLFMRGKRINKTLHDLFKNSQWAKVYDINRGGGEKGG
jgi:hypothetical protein